MENQRVYYFCPVFSFTVPSTRVEADHFLPLTIGVRGHTQTVHVNAHSLLHTYRFSHSHGWQQRS